MPSSGTGRYFTRSSGTVTPENNSNDDISECSSSKSNKQVDMSCPRPTRRKAPSCSSSSSSLMPISVPCPCKLEKYIKCFKVIIVIFLFLSIVYFISDHNCNFFLRELNKLRGHISNVEEIVQKVNVKKCDVDKQLQEITKTLPTLKGMATCLKDDIKKCGKSSSGWFKGPDILSRAVKAEIEIYDADKTDKVDFALESSGGMIVSTKNTESFNSGPSLALFGIPLCTSSNKPSALIQPGVMPGECWAFRGSCGSSVIKLINKIYVTGVSLEHIPRSISPTGNIDTAPKEFSIWGYKCNDDPEPFFFGQFTYCCEGTHVQYFPVKHRSSRTFEIIEFKVHSNYGHPDYTCVYRLRVHGDLKCEVCPPPKPKCNTGYENTLKKCS